MVALHTSEQEMGVAAARSPARKTRAARALILMSSDCLLVLLSLVLSAGLLEGFASNMFDLRIR